MRKKFLKFVLQLSLKRLEFLSLSPEQIWHEPLLEPVLFVMLHMLLSLIKIASLPQLSLTKLSIKFHQRDYLVKV